MTEHDDLQDVSIAELLAADNWQSQYRLITQWGRLIRPKPDLRTPDNLLRGCETPAWLAHCCHKGVHYFRFDSDSRVINGLAALLLSQLQRRATADIAAVDFAGLLRQVGLEKHLTPSRNNGLHAILRRARQLAASNGNSAGENS